MNLFLAPIQGMTVACYRNIFARIFGGIDAYYAPFIATADIDRVTRAVLKDLLPENNDPGLKIVPQLLSSVGSDFRSYAAAIADLGYNEINWNVGCPFPNVTNKKRGSGILPHTDMVRRFLEIACADDAYTLTVKMRLGFEDPEEGKRVIEVLNEYPLGSVIIHARTGVQMYEGSVDLDSFEALASACKHEVIYNGDIFTVDGFKRISSRYPALKGFMLGRGALRDPFLPSEIKGRAVPPSDKMSILRHFHDEVFDHYKGILSGERHLCDRMKEFWTYMSFHLDKDGKLMKKIKKCQTSAQYLGVVNPVINSPQFYSA